MNDDFIHANPDYYRRHLEVREGDPGYTNFLLNFFDDDIAHEVHALAFLHLLIVMQDALGSLFASLFGTPVTLKGRLSGFLQTFGSRLADLSSKTKEAKEVLQQLGLVSLDA